MRYGDISPAVAAYSVVRMLNRVAPLLGLETPEMIVVHTVDEFRALPDAERAARTVNWLKRLGRFTVGVAPREMDDHEIVAAILIGKGEVKRDPE